MTTTENISEALLQGAIDGFWTTVPPVWNRIKGNVRAIATENYDISVEQFHILRHIRKGLTSVSELAEVKQISRSAISQAVDILVDRGLICRRQNTKDRRNIPLELTESGDKLLDAVWEKNRAWMRSRMVSLTAQELETLTCAMEILSKTFAE
ncbi:MAG TPA: MarR family transcriptional regulator [Anaerolineales bacterium]|nr:MarR family transcriptional regulator [Anaerolineales bacterium]